MSPPATLQAERMPGTPGASPPLTAGGRTQREASMDAAWQAIAEAGPPVRTPGWDPRLIWLTLVLVAVILLGALVIAWLDRWRKRPGSERLSANDQLANFRALYENGQLSEEEFDRIRALLSRQMRRELDLPAQPPGSAPGQKPEPSRPAEPGNPSADK